MRLWGQAGIWNRSQAHVPIKPAGSLRRWRADRRDFLSDTNHKNIGSIKTWELHPGAEGAESAPVGPVQDSESFFRTQVWLSN